MMTLTYQRKAVAAQDGYDGELYLMQWPDGWEFLVFSSKESAERFEEAASDAKLQKAR